MLGFPLLLLDFSELIMTNGYQWQGVCDNLASIYCSWKILCARYFQNWCNSNAPCGLLVDSTTGSVGLIRKGSVSLFRGPEDIEQLLDGMPMTFGCLNYL